MSQRLTEQAAETARRLRVALGERLMEDAKSAPATSRAERPHRFAKVIPRQRF